MSALAELRLVAETCTACSLADIRRRAYPWWRDKVLVPTYHPAATLRGGDRITGLVRKDFDIMRGALDAATDSANGDTGGVDPLVTTVASMSAPDPQQVGLFG
ncbi:MAG: hypothetical protein WD990_04620 [Acidimicrobiia bacterium]